MDLEGEKIPENTERISVAMCGSRLCAIKTAKPEDRGYTCVTKTRMTVKPKVTRNTFSCPDCDNALFWETYRVKKVRATGVEPALSQAL